MEWDDQTKEKDSWRETEADIGKKEEPVKSGLTINCGATVTERIKNKRKILLIVVLDTFF